MSYIPIKAFKKSKLNKQTDILHYEYENKILKLHQKTTLNGSLSRLKKFWIAPLLIVFRLCV